MVRARDTQVLLNELLETIAATDDGNVAALAQANEEIAELVERSSRSHVKLREVATRIVELADAEVERRRARS